MAVIFALQIQICFSQNWVQLQDFLGTARDDGTVFTINNKAYCFSGLQVGGCTGDGFVFDALTETWGFMASLPAGKERQYGCGFSYSNFGYLLGGINCSDICLTDFWQYNPGTNTWTPLPDFPAQGRQGMSNFVLNDKVFIIAGKYSDASITNEVWEYNFTNATWTQKNNLPFSGIWRGAAFQINNIGYVCYGYTNNDNYNRSIYKYDQVNDAWQIIPNITLPARNYIGCAITSNKAFLYGGEDSLHQIKNDVYLFDPSNNSVNTYTGIPTIGRKGGMAFALNNILYISTGLDSNPARTKETWKNDQFVGLKENNLSKNMFSLYPNPASNEIRINSAQSIHSIIITSLLGKNVMELNEIHSPEFSVQLSNLAEGVYIVNIITTNSFQNRKLIIKR